MSITFKKMFVLGAGLLAVASANAAPFAFTDDFSAGVGPAWSVSTSFNNGDAGILGQLENGSATLSLTSPGAGTGTLDFDLLGFRTLDGVNCCTDTFTLYVNSTAIFQGNFNMGGGGAEQVTIGSPSSVSGSGQSRTISVAVSLLAGANTFKFDYGQMQGFGDEAWGLDNVKINGSVTAVPEPESLALALAGLAMVVGLRRRAAA
jgi:MYXO-CTERM domain-containing protein